MVEMNNIYDACMSLPFKKLANCNTTKVVGSYSYIASCMLTALLERSVVLVLYS